MEIIFVSTHIIMVICLASIILVSLSSADDQQVIKRSLISDQVSKIKSKYITSTSLYNIAAGLLAVFIR